MPEDVRLRINTRSDWGQWVSYPLRSAEVSRRMIELGSHEFVRFRGVRTVEVTVVGTGGTRMMAWRGTEEVGVIHVIADNPDYVSNGLDAIIHGEKASGA